MFFVCILFVLSFIWFSLVAQLGKNLPAMWETWVQSLGQGDPLEKGMATHSSILAWRVLWTEEPSGLQRSPWGHTESDMTEQLTFFFYLYTYILQRDLAYIASFDC